MAKLNIGVEAYRRPRGGLLNNIVKSYIFF